MKLNKKNEVVKNNNNNINQAVRPIAPKFESSHHKLDYFILFVLQNL